MPLYCSGFFSENKKGSFAVDTTSLTHREIDDLCFVLMQEIERCEQEETNDDLHKKEYIPKYQALYKKVNRMGMLNND